MHDYILVIPARYNSKRLPGKPLMDICGIPMLVRTYNQCVKVVKKEKIYVATDDKRITKICRDFDIQYILTSKKCLTGTDRIAELSKKVKSKIYLNVQGDEPLCNVNDLKKLLKYSFKYPNQIINGYTEIKKKDLFNSSHIPKVVFRNDGRLLYQSRAPIPTTKNKKFVKAWRQVCLYSLPYKSLQTFSKYKKKTILESIEDCELLRFLELGLDVKLIKMSDKSIAVDTIENLQEVRKIIKQNAK